MKGSTMFNRQTKAWYRQEGKSELRELLKLFRDFLVVVVMFLGLWAFMVVV